MEQLAGKVAVVTGAASGIGRALARSFCAEGMKLVLADVEAEPLAAVALEFERAGAEVLAVPTDVSDARAMDELADRTLARFAAVHVLCNNAGVGSAGAMWELSTAEWEMVLGPNLWGVIHGVRVFARHMVAQNEGHIVNTASVAGLISLPRSGPYNVSKHGVVALSETLDADLREANSAVRVSVLCPGFVNTRIFDAGRHRVRVLGEPTLAPTDLQQRLQLEALLKQLAPQFMSPDDVAAQVLEAIRTNRFYVLTHAATRDAVRSRMEAICVGGPPSMGDPGLFIAGRG